MHFTASVPAGRELCGDIGTRVAPTVIALVNDEQPRFMVPFDISPDSIVQIFNCYDGPAFKMEKKNTKAVAVIVIVIVVVSCEHYKRGCC